MRALKTLWWWELRAAMRERNLVVYSVLIPLTMYPLLIWVFLTGLSFVQGQVDDETSTVVVVADAQADAERIADALGTEDRIEVQTATGEVEPHLSRLRNDELDAVIAVTPATSADSTNVSIALHFDGTDDLSRAARDRVEDQLDDYRATWLEDEASRLAVPTAEWQRFVVKDTNTASGSDMGAFILGLIAPATMVVMIVLGTMYPAIDTIAGERERSTWETSLTLGVSRQTIVTAKFLYVATMGTIAGLLNLAGMTAAMAVLVNSSLTKDIELSVSFPPTAIPTVIVGTVAVALLLSALYMLAVPFARTFKEGQSLASPLLMIAIAPVFLADVAIDTVGLGMAAVPIANVMIVFKMVLSDALRLDFALVSLLSVGLVIAAVLWLSARITGNETLMLGVFEGSPTVILKRLLKGKLPR